MKYLNIAPEAVVVSDDIIGIFDLDTSTVKADTRNMLKRMENEGKVKNAFDPVFDIPLTFVLTCQKNNRESEKIIFSSTSLATIKGRVFETKKN